MKCINIVFAQQNKKNRTPWSKVLATPLVMICQVWLI